MSKTTLMREWAESVMNSPIGSREKAEVYAAEHILATTTEPTMADVEWDWDKHLLAGATLEADGETLEAIMIEFDDGFISYVTLNGERGFAYAEALTPNDKRYELREVTVDEHPETLTTLEDYENAPLGTVVEGEGKLPWTRLEYIWKETAGDVKNNVGMAGTERRVLRRGWGE